MEVKELLNALIIAEKLKDTTRHCYTSKGRHESVAEHSWMMTVMAFFMKNEFPNADMNTKEHECTEENLLNEWVESLPEATQVEMKTLYKEMEERQSIESKIYKAIDSLEALIQHNLSDISTWSENEFTLNLTYADDKVDFSKYLSDLRNAIRVDTINKINK